MNNSSFLGINGYVHWNGVVEATNDPLQMGRCRVRIFGWHSDNKQEIPTSHLPWAVAVLPTNGSKSFSTPLEGDYVIGYFADGKNGQIPLVTGVIPGYVAKAMNVTQGFTVDPTSNPIKTDTKTNRAPLQNPGEPSTPRMSRGNTAGSSAANTNMNLDHACDFKFQLDLNVGLGTLMNPAAALQQAIKNGKNRAAAMMRLVVSKINDELRLALKAIIAAMGFDPSGTLSFQYSYAKDIFRKINQAIKKVAQVVEDISFVVNMVKEIQQIIDYLNSLPAKMKAIIKECITRFMSSIKSVIGQLKAIPGQIGDNLEGILSNLSGSANDSVKSLQAISDEHLSSSESIIATIVNNPEEDHSTITSTYLTATFANTETTIANAQANQFDITQNLPP